MKFTVIKAGTLSGQDEFEADSWNFSGQDLVFLRNQVVYRFYRDGHYAGFLAEQDPNQDA
jgi:hypothetical protein